MKNKPGDHSKQNHLTPVQRLLLLVILAIATYLRVGQPGLIIWGNDGADVAISAVRMVEGQEFPRVGLVSSLGVHQPPLFTYLLAPFFLINRSPLFVGVCIGLLNIGAVALCFVAGRRFFNVRVGLIAAALFAVSPWAVIRGRSIWPQDLLPVFSSGLLYLWCAYLNGRKPWQLGGVVLLSLAAAQIHLIAATYTLLLVLVWLALRFPLHWKAVGAGVAVNVVCFLPYISYQLDHQWQDWQLATAVLKQVNEPTVYSLEGIHPQYGFPFPSRQHALQLANMASGAQIEDVLGLSLADFQAQDAIRLWQKVIALHRLVFLLACAGLGILVVRTAKGAQRFPFVQCEPPHLTLLFLWVTAPLAFFTLSGMRSYLSYFAVVFPAVFLLVAWALDQCARFLSERAPGTLGQSAGVGVAALVTVLALGETAYLNEFYRFIDQNGGPRGVIGVPYKYQVALADSIARAASTANPLISEDWPPKTPVHRGIQYLVWLRLRDRPLPTAPPIGQSQTAFVVLDTRFGLPTKLSDALAAQPFQTFGSLRLYQMPLTSTSP